MLPKPSRPKPGSRWRHYRTGGVYEVVDLAFFVTKDRDEWHVVYRDVVAGNTFSRTWFDFTALVTGDGKTETRRFTEVAP